MNRGLTISLAGAGTLLLWALTGPAGQAQPTTAPPAPPNPSAPQPAPDASVADPIPAGAELPPEHLPRLEVALDTREVSVGALVELTLSADAKLGDDVTIPDQSFSPFEVRDRVRRVEPPKDGRQRFVFRLTLQVFEAGELSIPEIDLRVVTADNQIGTVHTAAHPVTVASGIANEPNAKLKPESEPVVVMEDDFTLAYVAFGLLGALAIAALTLLVQRYLQRRPKPAPPPPPPRPPWEIATEKLAHLRRQKQRMLETGQGVQFVDEVSDAVREYLGGCYRFEGLDTTTEEMLERLRQAMAPSGLQDETRTYLRRCDLVKFAKVEPDQDEVDLILGKAQDIVQFGASHGVPDGRLDAQDPAAPPSGAPPARGGEG